MLEVSIDDINVSTRPEDMEGFKVVAVHDIVAYSQHTVCSIPSLEPVEELSHCHTKGEKG